MNVVFDMRRVDMRRVDTSTSCAGIGGGLTGEIGAINSSGFVLRFKRRCEGFRGQVLDRLDDGFCLGKNLCCAGGLRRWLWLWL